MNAATRQPELSSSAVKPADRLGFTLFLAVLTILGNLIADVLYAWADPRIRVRS